VADNAPVVADEAAVVADDAAVVGDEFFELLEPQAAAVIATSVVIATRHLLTDSPLCLVGIHDVGKGRPHACTAVLDPACIPTVRPVGR
jgi:hypothetical protein